MYNFGMFTQSLLHLIGNTPLVELSHLSPKPGIRIFAKLEGQNPSGSIKDRIVLNIVEEAERLGHLKPGDTIVEASSGNTGIALALVGKQKGYQVRVVIPREVAPGIGDILNLYEAQVEWCDPEVGMKGAIDIARDLGQGQGHYFLGQFDAAANLQAHYQTTGPEIVRALPQIDVCVAGIGTGGTIMGVGRCIREANPHVRIIGVEPLPGERLQGLRSLSDGYIPPLLDLGQLNGRYLVAAATAIDTAHLVAQTEGILVGISSGATLNTALRVAKHMDRGNIVVIFSDGGWKYLPARPWDAAHAGSEALNETHWW
jgi:cysteine synthase B